jgi:hypothetical protein
MDMVSLPWKLFFETHSYQFFTHKQGFGLWQPRGVVNMKLGVVFIGKDRHQLFDKAANI